MITPSASTIARRSFLRSATAATAAAFSVPAFSANDRISTAFICVGVMNSNNLGTTIKLPGVAVTAMCDVYQPNLEKASALARRAGHQPKEVGTSVRSSPIPPSTPCASLLPTIGTPILRLTRAKPARTSTLKIPLALPMVRVLSWSKPPANSTASFRQALGSDPAPISRKHAN